MVVFGKLCSIFIKHINISGEGGRFLYLQGTFTGMFPQEVMEFFSPFNQGVYFWWVFHQLVQKFCKEI